jgi:hypothetical protein
LWNHNASVPVGVTVGWSMIVEHNHKDLNKHHCQNVWEVFISHATIANLIRSLLLLHVFCIKFDQWFFIVEYGSSTHGQGAAGERSEWGKNPYSFL